MVRRDRWVLAIIIVGVLLGMPKYKKLLWLIGGIWLILALIVEMKNCG